MHVQIMRINNSTFHFVQTILSFINIQYLHFHNLIKMLNFFYFKPEDLSVTPTLKGGYPSREENTLLFQQPIYFSLNLLEKNCIKQCTNNRHALGRPLAIQALTNLDSWSALTSKIQGASAALCIAAATALVCSGS